MRNLIVQLMSLALITALGAAPALAAGQIIKAGHSVTYSAQGTRSEAQHGHLSLDGAAVPDCFTRIEMPERTYCFRQRANMWGSDGYWPCDPPIQPQKYGEKLNSAELEQGWRVGEDRPRDLPPNWVHALWKDGSAWAACNRLADLANALKLPTIPHQAMQMMMREKRP